MKRFLISVKENVTKLNDFLKKIEQIPSRAFQGDFFEEEESIKPAPRKNKVKVEDLRPKKCSDDK